MAKVDFYIVNGSGPEDSLRVACRLAEKAWRQGNRVCVQLADADAMRHLDTLLWTFKQESFVPHEIEGGDPGAQSIEPPPVVLVAGASTAESADVLINLAGAYPDNAAGFPRIAEVVAADAESKNSARDRYRRYRDQGFELNSHEV